MKKNYGLPEESEKRENRRKEFLDKLSESVKGLIFVSEIDSDYQIFHGRKATSVDSESLFKQLKIMKSGYIEKIEFANFFAPLIEFKDWYREEERKMTEKNIKLKEILEENLYDLKVYKIGKTKIDIYIVGLDEQDNLCGVKTCAIET